jgi:hypothetical protein
MLSASAPWRPSDYSVAYGARPSDDQTELPSAGAFGSMNRFWDSFLRKLTEATQARCLVEVGVDTGLLTEKILDYCASSGAVLHAIDPAPQVDVDEWRQRYGELLVFHQHRSLEVLDGIHHVDVAYLDGDHNWFSVYHELKVLENTALKDGSMPPLIALHDVGWPYGRRDMYYDPSSVPEAHRQPHQKLGLVPGEVELVDGGMNWHVDNAISEGTPHNGVRTALEDFVTESAVEWQVSYVAGFHGLGIAAAKDRLAENETLARAVKSLRSPDFLDGWMGELELARIRTEISTEMAFAGRSERDALNAASLRESIEERDRLGELLLQAETRLAGVPDLEGRIAELERELHESRAAAEAAREHARVLDERLTRSARVLTDVMTSPSWRLTKPLRTAKHMLVNRG